MMATAPTSQLPASQIQLATDILAAVQVVFASPRAQVQCWLNRLSRRAPSGPYPDLNLILLAVITYTVHWSDGLGFGFQGRAPARENANVRQWHGSTQ